MIVQIIIVTNSNLIQGSEVVEETLNLKVAPVQFIIQIQVGLDLTKMLMKYQASQVLTNKIRALDLTSVDN